VYEGLAARHHAPVPRDPRGPEYGAPSRLERVVTSLLAVGAVVGLALVGLSLVADVAGLLGALGPPWLVIAVASAIVVVVLVVLTG
jgi:hypothetical protein